MNRNSRLATLVLTAAALAAAQASHAGTGFYVGGSWGRTGLAHDVAAFDDGSLGGSGEVDTEDSGWKLLVGYQVNRGLALEIGHTVLNNDYDLETTLSGAFSDGSGGFAAGGVTIDLHRPKATYAAAVALLPLGPRVSLSARVGAQAWEAQLTTSQSSGVSTERRSDLDALAGLGLTYRLTRHWRIQLDYERFMDVVDADIDLVSIGISYQFRAGQWARGSVTKLRGGRVARRLSHPQARAAR